MSTVAIINAKASRATLSKAEYKRLFSKANVKLKRLEILDNPKDLPAVLEKYLKQGPDCVVIGGGDGTIMAFADIAKKTDYKGNLAILPVGTANYLARNLNIPLDIEQAVRVINTGKRRKVNLPRVNKVLFSLLLGIGVVAAASAGVSVKLKRKVGQLAYVLETIKQLQKHESFAYHIKTKDGQTLKGRSHQIMLINADVSQQLDLIPDSTLSIPTMTLNIYESNSSKLRLIITFGLYIISFGRIRRGLKVIHDTGFTIRTKPTQKVSVDGEVSLETPLEVSASYSRINVLCP